MPIHPNHQLMRFILATVGLICNVFIFFLWFLFDINKIISPADIQSCPASKAKNYIQGLSDSYWTNLAVMCVQAFCNIVLVVSFLFMLSCGHQETNGKKIFWNICSMVGMVATGTFFGNLLQAYSKSLILQNCTTDKESLKVLSNNSVAILIPAVLVLLIFVLLFFIIPKKIGSPQISEKVEPQPNQQKINPPQPPMEIKLDEQDTNAVLDQTLFKSEHHEIHDQGTQMSPLKTKKNRIFGRKSRTSHDQDSRLGNTFVHSSNQKSNETLMAQSKDDLTFQNQDSGFISKASQFFKSIIHNE